MFPFVRPLNIHPPAGGYTMNFSHLPEEERYINVPLLKHDYELYPEKKSDLAICVIPANDKAMLEYKITKSTIENYAKKCGADLIELFGDVCPHWPLLNKYRVSFVTSKYHRTLYLDTDVLIADDAPNIFEITPEDKFCIYNELPDLINNNQQEAYNIFIDIEKELCEYFNLSPRTNKLGFNAGIMLIPNKLSHYYQQPNKNKIPKQWTLDQIYLALTIPDEHLFLLNEKFNHLYFKIDFWENIHDTYFIHVAGSGPAEYRLELLNRIKNKNYKPFLPPNSALFKPKWIEKYVT